MRGRRRHTAQASRLRDSSDESNRAILRETVRATGPTPEAALAFVLAKLLVRDAFPTSTAKWDALIPREDPDRGRGEGAA